MSRPHCAECRHWHSEEKKWGRCDLRHSRPFIRTYEDGFKQKLWTSEYSYLSDNCKKWERMDEVDNG